MKQKEKRGRDKLVHGTELQLEQKNKSLVLLHGQVTMASNSALNTPHNYKRRIPIFPSHRNV